MKGWKYSDRHPGGDARRSTNGDRMRVSQGIKALVATAFTGGLVASALVVAPAAARAGSTRRRARAERVRAGRVSAVLPRGGADRGLRVEADQVAQARIRGLWRGGFGQRLP